jgi:hypothetical protein
MGRLLDLFRCALGISRGVPNYEINEKKVASDDPAADRAALAAVDHRTPHLWGAHGDQYGWRLNAAFEFIFSQDYPVGVIPWLESAAPWA